MAAAASSLKGQAQELVQTVAVFKLTQGQTGNLQASAPVHRIAPKHFAPAALPKKVAPKLKPTAKPAALSAPKAAPPKASPSAGGHADGDDWETF
jgi:methyl-accepting chemotaxis protein